MKVGIVLLVENFLLVCESQNEITYLSARTASQELPVTGEAENAREKEKVPDGERMAPSMLRL